MNKKQLLGILILCSLISVFAYAKPSPPPKPMTADDIVAKLKLQLGLSDAQAIEVKPIIEEHLAKEKELKLEEKKELSKVLTGDQLFTWDFLQNEQPKEKKKHSL